MVSVRPMWQPGSCSRASSKCNRCKAALIAGPERSTLKCLSTNWALAISVVALAEPPMPKLLVQLRVNGRNHELAIEPNWLLLDVLRQELDLTGSKRGCDDSSCGACAVLIDEVPMMACTLLAASCEGAEITTVEGLANHGALNAIQQA